MSDLPSGWGVATIEELAGAQGLVADGDWIESKDQDPDGNVRLIQLADIGDGDFRDRSSRFVSEGTARRLRCTYLEPGDVLIARMPDPLGRACILPSLTQPAITAVDVFIWRGHEGGADARWMMHAVNSPEVRAAIASQAGGTTRQRVSGGRLKQLPLPVPPLPEQRRIVAKIESLTGKSKRARDHLDHIPRLVEKYKQTLLAAAFRGNLTRESDRRHCWPRVTAGTVIRDIVAGKNLRCEERPPEPNEKGVVKVSAVTWGAFDPAAAKTLPSAFSPSSDTLIRPGDLLISRANTIELVGAVVLVQNTPSNLYLSDKVLRLDMTDEDKSWLMWFLRSPQGREAIEGSATGNQLSMRNLSQAALKAIELPWPEPDERHEIIKRIEVAFTWIDHLASESTSARKQIDHLDQAVLAKAVRGELVPQDPTDEPASVLLERIKTERRATPVKRRKRGNN